MNKQQILGLIRHLLTFGGGFILAKGWMDEALFNELSAAVVTITGLIWSTLSPEKTN